MQNYNSEQELAIFHEGNVLLDAGAGAGKTFVIVEHLIYLLKKFIKEYESDSKMDFDFFISDKLSKIVVMTFTLKATREISVRIQKRVQQEVMSVPDLEKECWETIKNSITSLKINTIHGVCFSLLKEFGHKVFNNNFKIGSSIVLKDKVSNLIDSWFEEHNRVIDNFTFLNHGILKSIISALFDDPELRSNFGQAAIKNSDSETIIQKLIQILDFKYLFSQKIDLADFESYQKSKWYQLILEFQKSKDVVGFCMDVARLPPVPKTDEALNIIVNFFEEFKQFRDHCRNLMEIKAQYNLTQNEFERIQKTVLNIYNYVEANYLQDDSISFSDLEYFALKLLNHTEVQSQIVMKFSYFIVDEFQDTSSLQFSILKKLINNDFNKLFCVGDLKQAIYGFRGGEIDVFNECGNLIKYQYKLLSNYRSNFSVVDFNNTFFASVFIHKNINREMIKFSSQKSIHEAAFDNRSVFKLVPLKTLEVIELTELDLDEVEANLIFNYLVGTDLDNVAILYKVLSPSHHLIEKFFKSNLLVSVQIKIPLSEDWINGIFKLLLSYSYDKNKSPFQLFMLRNYLEVFNVKIAKDDLTNLVENFCKNSQYLSIYNAFILFIKALNISFSSFKQSFSLLENICLIAVNRVEKILKIIDNYSDQSSSFELELNGGKVINLMTTHASKGLEFDHVIVAGIYSNFRGKNSSLPIGENIDSLTYKSEIVKNESVKTPLKYLDEVMGKLKDKSEADRLLYVACTRAKKNLVWAHLDFLTLDKINQNAWAYHFCHWDSKHPFAAKEIFIGLAQCKKEDVTKVPILHMDNFTVMKMESSTSYLVLPELSATKLASVALCSRKFYFKNICKIEESDLEILDLMPKFIQNDKQSDIINSSERGLILHKYIENFIKLKKLTVDVNETEALSYLKSELDIYNKKEYKLFSELGIKFKLFNFMLSGVIDLLVLGQSSTENLIIDFKTGGRKVESEEHYWFQLTAYAYGLFELNKLNKSDKIKIQIIYIDEKCKIDRVLSFSDTQNYLFNYWNKLNSFDQLNLNHCHQCEYNKICQV